MRPAIVSQIGRHHIFRVSVVWLDTWAGALILDGLRKYCIGNLKGPPGKEDIRTNDGQML